MREDADVVMITGQTQSGKSTLASKIIMQRERVLIVSPFPVKARIYPGVEQFWSIREAVEAFDNTTARTFRAAVVVNTVAEFEIACHLVWLLAQRHGEVTFVPDETMVYLPNPSETPMPFKIISQAWAHSGDDVGRDCKVRAILIGQRPINAPPIFRAEVQVWYLFRLNAEQDRALLRDNFGLTREAAAVAGKLPPYHYMRVNRYGDITRGQTSV